MLLSSLSDSAPQRQMPHAKIQLFAKSWVSPPFGSYHWPACLSITNDLQYLGHTHLKARSWLILMLGRQPFTQCPLLLVAQYIWRRMINAMVYIWLQSPCQCQQLKWVKSPTAFRKLLTLRFRLPSRVTWERGTGQNLWGRIGTDEDINQLGPYFWKKWKAGHIMSCSYK